ncbi:hypothetical protein GTQ43_19420 [Nostoc sp. KVJ3]|uniref:hypothetical protein n=1 Tax=Nostoc sp. KVJ3 TaxID=457945 RepID=UPI00223875AB|nr:hypothetical protein [Nostoc sp. KVJ3]MCW5315904.1 hypothetical protein [Nostoc sp. KVJ3]
MSFDTSLQGILRACVLAKRFIEKMRLAEILHQSCLVFTSQETPKGIERLTGEKLPIRAIAYCGCSTSSESH